ncbi:spermidine/putrescine ABC transporter substrate-binding protein [Candidatus Babeliales bacterium]|nr:spermidine/putrescine ABC transporter substrate-binding protein [Candidatus Babeliales bacterium]
MINKTKTTTLFIIRMAIVCFWFLGFILFLYGPAIIKFIMPRDRSINVYLITSIINSNLFDEFERKTGIKVHVKYFEYNSAMQTQMRISGGSGYDVITPSDYTVDLLRKENLLHQIDTSKLYNFNQLDFRLLNRDFDPNNKYSIPVCWSTYGIAYNKKWFKEFKKYPQGLDALFEPDSVWKGPEWEKRKDLYRVCVMDDPRDMIFLASLYLYGLCKTFSKVRLEKIRKILVKQKQWIGGYAESNLPYYLSGVYPVAFATASLMIQMLKEDYDFGFVLPKEGSLITIENLAIPKNAEHVEEAHLLIDFLLSKQAQIDSFNEYGFTPSNKDVYSYLENICRENYAIFPDDSYFKKLHPIHSGLSVKDAHELWIDVKSR